MTAQTQAKTSYNSYKPITASKPYNRQNNKNRLTREEKEQIDLIKAITGLLIQAGLLVTVLYILGIGLYIIAKAV